MIKVIKGFIYSLIIMYSVIVSSNVSADNLKINDYAKLYNTDEIQKLSKSIEDIINTHNIDVVVVTTNDVEGKTSRDYADDFYDYNGYGINDSKDGLLFLINMEDREVYISTSGSAIDYLSDSRIDKILDYVYKDLGSGNYYTSTDKFLKQIDYYMTEGRPNNHYRTDEEGNVVKAPLTKQEKANRIFISFLVSTIIASISCVIVVWSYKKPRKISGENYVDKKSIVFNIKRDEFITSHVSKVKIERNNSGGSSTHTSSSGNTHGGGGRGF